MWAGFKLSTWKIGAWLSSRGPALKAINKIYNKFASTVVLNKSAVANCDHASPYIIVKDKYSRNNFNTATGSVVIINKYAHQEIKNAYTN